MITLRHFTESEFRSWGNLIDEDLLLMVDEFRHQWGSPTRVSPVNGAIGRHMGPEAKSQHNIDRWGKVKAIDLMPMVKLSGGALTGMTLHEMNLAYQIAKKIGFTGIGIYPDWKPVPGIHLDNRADRESGSPATWAGIRKVLPGGKSTQRYVSIEEVLE